MTTLKNKKGVSLVELIAVIVIMGIIATVGGISVATIIENSNKSAAATAVSDVMAAGKSYLQSNTDKTSVDLATLESEGYVEKSLVGKFEASQKTTIKVTVTSTTSEAGNTVLVYHIFEGATEGTVKVKGYTVTYSSADGSFKATKGAGSGSTTTTA